MQKSLVQFLTERLKVIISKAGLAVPVNEHANMSGTSTFFYWKGPDFRAPGAPWALPPSGKILGALRAPGALINKYTEKTEVFRAFKPKHSFTFFGQLAINLH